MADTFYPSEQAAVTALLPGYKVVGRAPHMVTVTNPAKTPSHPEEPATIQQQKGWDLSVQGPNKEPDTITVSDLGPNPSNTGGPKGGVGVTVIEGPKKAPPATGSPLSDWDRLDKNGTKIAAGDTTTVATAIRDPKAPPGTPPYTLQGGGELGDPSTWTPITVDGRTVGLYDPKSQKVAASVSQQAGNKPSDPTAWTPVYRTPGEKASGIVGQWDPVNSELHAVATQADGKQIVTVPGQGVYSYDKDTDKLNLLQALDKNATLQVVTYPDGSIYTIDPNEKDPSKQLTKLQGNQPPQTMVQHTPGGDLTLIYDPETKTYKPPPGVTPPASVDSNTTALKKIIWRNAATGEVISEKDNPNYVAPQTTQGAGNTTSRQIQKWDPQKGDWVWEENKGRVVASQALHDMAEQLTHQVVAGDISQDEAVALINAANAKMTNDIAQQQNQRGAAGDILSNAASNAQTGAGMLNQRVSSATSALSNMMGTIGSSKITDIPSDFGKNLVGGLSNWVTNMGGGDAVYETAARMVQGADPKISGDPTLAQQATQTLAQMMQQYQTQSGKPYPDVAATIAAKGSQAANGVVAPVTIAGNAQGQQTNVGVDQALQQQQAAAVQQAQAQAAAMKARGLLDNPQGRAIAAGQTPVAMQGAPTTPGLYNPAWQQGIISGVGLPSVGPNAANGFVAPPLPLIPA